MSLSSHTLKQGLNTKTLADWGIESCVVEQELGLSGGRMMLTLARDVDAGELWPAYSKLTLRDPSGTVQFVGLSINPPRSATASEEVRTYEVVGIGAYLDWVTYKQYSMFAADVENPASPTGPRFVSRLTLNRNATTGEAITIKQQIELILEYVVMTKGAPFEYASANLPSVNAPEDEVLDLRAGEAIAAELAWCPHIGARWDYSGLIPVLEFGDVVSGDFGSRVLKLAGGVESWQGVPRYDLLSPQVRIDYIGQASAVDGDYTFQWLTLNSDISTVANGAWGAEEMTIVLRGLAWDGERYTAGEPRPPNGLAAALHKAYSRLFYDMSWTAVSEEVSWVPQVGEQWSVSGAGLGFATADAVCQRITRDIGSGTMVFQCGAPAHLGLGKRLDLLRANRLRQIARSAGEQTYGFADPKSDPTGGSGGSTAITAEFGVQTSPGVFERQVVEFQGTVL